MLYDVLPLLVFFASFGGIIVIFSRVVVRVRRQHFAAHIRAHVHSQRSLRADRVLQPGVRGIQLMKSRLAFVPHTVKVTVRRMRVALREWGDAHEGQKVVSPKPSDVRLEHKSADEGILVPQTTWRGRVEQAAARGRRTIASVNKSVADALSRQLADSEEKVSHKAVETKPGGGQRISRPKLHLIHVSARGAPSKDIQSRHTHRVVSKSRGRRKKKEVGKPRRKLPISRVLRTQKESSPLQQAVVAMKDEKYDEAEDVLIPYIVDHARDTQAYMLLGKAALAQCAWDEAIEIYEQVLKINSRQKGAHAALGYAAMKAGRFTLALQMLQRAHDEAPTNKRVIKQLLNIAQRMDNGVLQRTLLEELAELKRMRSATGDKVSSRVREPA